MSTDDQNRKTDQETLVAYLDGELSETEIVEVEKRLTSSDELRQQLNGLERTWDMLDELPAVEPTESFTRSTLEMAIGDQVKTVLYQRKKSWTVPLRAAIMILFPLLACLGTYAFAKWRQKAPLRSLVSDMSLLSNYELYESAKTFEFAKLLYANGVFHESLLVEEPAEFVWEGSEETLESLSDERKADLQRKVERFGQLPEPNQQAFRDFHKEMVVMENRDALMDTLRFYDTWLQEIGRDKMLELQSKPPEERIIEIRRIERAMRRNMFGNSIDEEDKEVVFQWFEKLANDNEKFIRTEFKKLKASSRRFNWVSSKIAIEDSLRILIGSRINSVLALVTDEKFMELYNSLGPRTKKMIDDKGENNRKRFVLILNSQPYVTDADLRDFYQTQLSAEQHKTLDKLSPTELKERLLRLYLEHRYRNRVASPKR